MRRYGRDSMIAQMEREKGSPEEEKKTARTACWTAQTMARAGVERQEWQCLELRVL